MKRLAPVFLSVFFTAAPLFAFEYGGYLQVDYYGNIETTTPYRSDRSRIYLQPWIADRLFDDVFSYRLSANLYWQPLTDNTFTPKKFVDPSYIIREAFVGLHFPYIDIYLGHRFVNWGKVDVLSPLNVINPSDLTVLALDNGEESSLSDLLAQVQLYMTKNIFLDLVYVPFFQPNILPVTDYTLIVPADQLNVLASFRNRDYRIYGETGHSFHSSLNVLTEKVDVIVAYSFYRDQLLDIDLSRLVELPPPPYRVYGLIYPAYNRVHNFGAGLSTDFEGYGFSLDGAYKLTRDMNGSRMDIKNNEVLYNLQVDKKFFNLLYTQFNFIHRYVLDIGRRIRSNHSPLVQTIVKNEIDKYLFQKDASQIFLLLHLDVSLVNEKLTLGSNFIYGIAESEFYLAPRISYTITDHITFMTGADFWIGGSGDGYLSRNKLNDNFHVRFKFSL